MRCILLLFITLVVQLSFAQDTWIRVNQLGYREQAKKVAVWVSKSDLPIHDFVLRDAKSDKVVFKGKPSAPFGAYGAFVQSYRLDFSAVRQKGTYIVEVDGVKSHIIRIADDVYNGTADFALRYMRQQRTLFNPFLKDSCHTHDGFTMYAASVGLPDSTHVDVGGGWHDASDYLQYATTSANATYHLLAAYRDFPHAFTDHKQANGLSGANGVKDVLDEAKWGLDWLLKMHPEPHIMFNQIADDRDHAAMRMPGEDPYYGRGYERPVYFIDGEPQQRGKFLNNTTGTSSTASKFASAFNLGAAIFREKDTDYSQMLTGKARTAFDYAHKKLGVTQTVSVKSPYIYAEDNWVDDMELAYATMYQQTGKQEYLEKALTFAKEEPITPWMVRDTANHYQYYPFINLGHYELAKNLQGEPRQEVISYYKNGIEQVWDRAKQNAFYRGVPFIWCSNNLTVAFAMQCLWYKDLTNDASYDELMQANIDWLFGVNPWGTSMVYGLPAWGDTPVDPHSAFTHLHNYPIDGGLVDGPVYAAIFNNLIGIQLHEQDEYAEFQSDLVVYHDDYGDYSTNEPTMDGTASLIYLLSSQESVQQVKKDEYGAIVQGDGNKKQISLVFTAHDFNDGNETVARVLKKQKVKASFFLTGDFLRNKENQSFINKIRKNHYIGPHSDKHLLYATWENRDSTLVVEEDFKRDLEANYTALASFGIRREEATFFMPSYEWYNHDIVRWANAERIEAVNYTPGLRTAADYTYPEMGTRYMTSEKIFEQLLQTEKEKGLNGHIILIHLGVDKRRKDKLYDRLEDIIQVLRDRGYDFLPINEMLD
ncbi:glycoside hydrolase family 9 protein [Sphingobacterium wenxiniae]|uniref:Peptidoglycan/xylan/chitin deacetylase, PgdA/CDA1 family n=1 Tax=Sphingobacterium wenxiniae TaxID=683125 RepID=A0A1I6RBK4_9SPHI|nr:glycoside hydrolase family 9 protein [Sphingobacterium wenxiniae]SFS62099.1 Peptidoglycan/xylan/chitin deacetylase, PgdA/CDA1 family [Sphingobacterium wenxiniae]